MTSSISQRERTEGLARIQWIEADICICTSQLARKDNKSTHLGANMMADTRRGSALERLLKDIINRFKEIGETQVYIFSPYVIRKAIQR